jgi:hypothetical protein
MDRSILSGAIDALDPIEAVWLNQDVFAAGALGVGQPDVAQDGWARAHPPVS